MGWAKEAAGDIQASVEERLAIQKWTIFAHNEVKEKSDGLFDALAVQVEGDTKEFDEGRNHRSGLRVERLNSNNVTVQRYLAPLQKLAFIYTPKSNVAVFWNDRLIAKYQFSVDERGTVWFIDSNGLPVTVEDISRAAFGPLIKLYKQALL